MNNVSRCLQRTALRAAVLAMILMTHAAFAKDGELTCPASATSGGNVSVTVDFENDSCAAIDYRILTSIVGNGNDTLGGIGIYGPAVAEPTVIVPAGSGVAFCGCGEFTPNICSCSGNSCSVDADCPFCTAVTPATLSVPVDVVPVLPTALTGTVATVIVINEANIAGEIDSQIYQCFVEVL